jgi:guanylate kinase
MNKTIIALCGKSATGKTTVAQYVLGRLQAYDSNVFDVVSATTRPIRLGEKDGVDYFFLSEEDFLQKIENNEFLEYTRFRDWWYGTLASSLQDNGLYIMVVNAQGLKSLSHLQDEYQVIPFYLQDSFEIRLERSIRREGQLRIEHLRRVFADFKDFLGIKQILKTFPVYFIFPNNSSIQEKVHTIIQYVVLLGILPYQKYGQNIINFDFQKSYLGDRN